MRLYKQLAIMILPTSVLATGAAAAQPMAHTFATVESRIAEADAVVRGTIAKLSAREIVPPGGRDDKGILQPDGIYEHTIIVKVDEVLKGDIKGNLEDLRPIEAFRFDRYFEGWMKARTPILWFLGPAPAAGDKRGWNVLRLGARVEAESSSVFGPPLFSMDFSVLRNEKDILAAARVFAKQSPTPLPIHAIRIPEIVALRAGGGATWNHLLLPVEPSLEQRARRLIASPQDFLPKGAKLDALARHQLRYGGVTSLGYFKSDANAGLLLSLLDERADAREDGAVGRLFPVRTKALEVLLGWGVDFPMPKSAQALTSLDLHGAQLTNTVLKRVGELKDLTTLDLTGAKMMDNGLRELAPLKKLILLRLSEKQLTDSFLAVLREIGLLHAISPATGTKSDVRPTSADEVTVLQMYWSPVTDAGLKELAVFTNLAALYLDSSHVTGAGLKELAGLKSLTRLHLRGASVTDMGLKELARLPHLTHLALSETPVTDAGLKELAGLQTLVELDLSDTKVTSAGLRELARLKNLATLHLSAGQMTDAALAALRDTGMLHVYRTAVARGDKRPKTEQEIFSLDLRDTPVSDAGLEALAGLGNLKHLGLGGTKVTGSGLKHLVGLKKLSDLHVDGAPLTAAGMRNLAGLKGLTTLHMHGRHVTDDRLRALCETGMLHTLYEAGARVDYPPATLPPRARSDDAVQSLHLGGWRSHEGTVVTDACLKDLAGLKNLARLELTHTAVTGTGLKELTGLKKLSRLSLGGPQVTDAGLKDLPSLKSLTSLGLHDTKITTAGAKDLARLENLTTLHLTGMAVTDAWLKELAALKNLTHLRLYWTAVTDAGVAEFLKAVPRCEIER